MERAVALDLYGRPVRLNLPWWVWNMFGEQGVFLLSRGGNGAVISRASFRGDAKHRARNARNSGSGPSDHPGMTTQQRRLRPAPPHRPRIPHRPSSGLDQRDEPLHHLVEQRGLFQIEHVAGFREERQSRGGQMLFQEQAGLDAIVVLVAAQISAGVGTFRIASVRV